MYIRVYSISFFKIHFSGYVDCIDLQASEICLKFIP